MRQLRGPSVPGFLLALLLGLSLPLPELGHSLAHSHAAEHHRGADPAPQHHAADVGLNSDEPHGDHPHLAVVATLSAKPSLAHAAVVQVDMLAAYDPRDDASLPHTAIGALPPDGPDHGPPPPARAPPLV